MKNKEKIKEYARNRYHSKEYCGKKQRKVAIKSKKSLQKSFLRAKRQKKGIWKKSTQKHV